MGLMNLISSGLTAGTQAAGANIEGQEQGSALLRQIYAQRAQIAKEQAETSMAQSHGHLFDREANMPRLGDGDSYNTAIGQAAGAKISGETPALADQTKVLAQPKADAKALEINTTAQPEADAAGLKATATLPMEKQLAAYRANQEGNKEIRVSGATVGDKKEIAMPRIAEGAAKQFVASTKSTTDAMNAYGQAKAAFAEAKRGNPSALKSAILAFAGVADPKANLRQGVINMISQVDPSVRGNFDLAVNRLSSGTLPPGTLANMEALVDRVGKLHRDTYDQRRKEFLSRVPEAERFVPSTDAIFTVPESATAPPSTQTPGTFHYNGVTYKAP